MCFSGKKWHHYAKGHETCVGIFIDKLYKRRQEPTTISIVLKDGPLTDKSDDTVGHLNTILVRGGANLNDPIFKSSNARGLLVEDVEVSS